MVAVIAIVVVVAILEAVFGFTKPLRPVLAPLLAEVANTPTSTRVPVPATSVPIPTMQSSLAMSPNQHIAVTCSTGLSLAQGDLYCLSVAVTVTVAPVLTDTPVPVATSTVPASTATAGLTDTPTSLPTGVPTSATPTASATSVPTSTPSPMATATPSVAPTSTVLASGPTWYVSRNGSNVDGRSWASAWTELSNINWALVQPGDTILVGTGTYSTALIPAKSGTASAPIKVLAQGPVTIFGGRSYNGVPFQLPEADFYTTANPPPAYTTPLNVGIDFSVNSPSYVVVDGGGWDGITVYGFSAAGVKFGGSSNNTVRNATVRDNGSIYLNAPSGTYRTRNPNIYPNGTNNTIDRVQVRDGGEDSLQTGQSLSNFTIKNSWLSNSRPSRASAQVPWNAQSHSDGFQSYSGGTTTGITIDSSIIGPGQMQGTILGQSGASTSVVNNVVIKNSLFINDFNADIMGYGGSPSQNWTLDHDTLYMNSYPGNYIPGLYGWSHAIYLEGAGHKLTNSIVYGGDVTMPAGTVYSNNCQFGLTGGNIGTNADPGFVRKPLNVSLADSTLADFTVTNPACAGKGSSITSVAMLLAQ